MASLTACQTGGGRLSLAEQIRGVGQSPSAGLQIYGLRNPIVTDLMRQALVAEQGADFDQAVGLLQEALVIEPDAPDILQQLAEVRVEQRRWRDAKALILTSIERGPRLGHLCQRNYRALSVVYAQLGDSSEAAKAAARVSLCERSKPEGF